MLGVFLSFMERPVSSVLFFFFLFPLEVFLGFVRSPSTITGSGKKEENDELLAI